MYGSGLVGRLGLSSSSVLASSTMGWSAGAVGEASSGGDEGSDEGRLRSAATLTAASPREACPGVCVAAGGGVVSRSVEPTWSGLFTGPSQPS